MPFGSFLDTLNRGINGILLPIFISFLELGRERFILIKLSRMEFTPSHPTTLIYEFRETLDELGFRVPNRLIVVSDPFYGFPSSVIRRSYREDQSRSPQPAPMSTCSCRHDGVLLSLPPCPSLCMEFTYSHTQRHT